MNQQPLAQDRAISRVMQHVCGVLALQAGFNTSSIGALTRLSDIALHRKFFEIALRAMFGSFKTKFTYESLFGQHF